MCTFVDCFHILPPLIFSIDCVSFTLRYSWILSLHYIIFLGRYVETLVEQDFWLFTKFFFALNCRSNRFSVGELIGEWSGFSIFQVKFTNSGKLPKRAITSDRIHNRKVPGRLGFRKVSNPRKKSIFLWIEEFYKEKAFWGTVWHVACSGRARIVRLPPETKEKEK